MSKELRCEFSQGRPSDITGEGATPCNEPGKYCPACDMVICSECHRELAPSGGHSRGKQSNPMRMQFRDSDLIPHGLEIGILGYKDNPANHPQWPSQIYIEFHEGHIRVHVWNGTEDPAATVCIKPTH